MRKRKLYILIPVCIVAFLAVVYAAGAVVFSFSMMPNSVVSNYAGTFDVSWKGERTVAQVLKMNDGSPFRIYRRKKEFSFPLAEIKAGQEAETPAISFIRKQPVWAWPVAVFQEKSYSFSRYAVDPAKLEQVLTTLQVCDGKPSENAYISVDDEGVFRIEEEIYGTEVDGALLKEQVLDCLDEGKTEFRITEDLYLKPEITKTDKSLKEQYNKIEKKVGKRITIDLFDAKEELAAGYFYDTDKILKEGKFKIRKKKIDAYMKYLIDTYETYGKKRTFRNHAGKEIQVGAEGDKVPDSYGFSMNVEETRKNLEEAIHDDDVTEVAAVWNQVGNGRDKLNGDIGTTYIEISIDEQHLWYYKNGKKVYDTDVVTGLPTALKHTPKGIYTMFWKDTNTRLRGNMAGESWDVRVAYWMSVTNTGIGIHTAPWQPSFGGDAYTYRGSHGCINVPDEAGKKLYEKVDVNTVVVIY